MRKKQGKGKEETSSSPEIMRLNRYLAHCGICSRREADNLILEGHVKVNGKTVKELGIKVGPKDVVAYKGKKLSAEKLRYVLLNKPRDFITTTKDERDRKTVMQLVKNACRERIYPVGRLDRNTTGLLLFTNDGELADSLMHPSKKVSKIYKVVINKGIREEDYNALLEGTVLDDGPAKIDDLAILSKDKKELGIEIHIGKNRIIRRLFEHYGYEVERLDRTTYAGLDKKDLPRGRWRHLTDNELRRLRHFI